MARVSRGAVTFIVLVAIPCLGLLSGLQYREVRGTASATNLDHNPGASIRFHPETLRYLRSRRLHAWSRRSRISGRRS